MSDAAGFPLGITHFVAGPYRPGSDRGCGRLLTLGTAVEQPRDSVWFLRYGGGSVSRLLAEGYGAVFDELDADVPGVGVTRFVCDLPEERDPDVRMYVHAGRWSPAPDAYGLRGQGVVSAGLLCSRLRAMVQGRD